ncbi:MAG TPA: DinB family protein [Anaerolineales bacterium]|nr:DinB family protein [Anaerolineales bacterium]HNN12374.1 DinB family protein [Anaerolineales bacterium]HNO31824.1 DinB family protein [Anaerolineales bacterium]
MPAQIKSPEPNEFAEFYSDYIRRADARGNVTSALASQVKEVRSALGGLSDSQARFRNGPAEWSIKEVISHLIDGERVFSYRLLRISRKDKTPLPGFEQGDYVRESGADEMPFNDLLDEFESLRRANILAVKNMSEEAVAQVGTASGMPISARALIYILVGHVEHHMASLKEKYLPFA